MKENESSRTRARAVLHNRGAPRAQRRVLPSCNFNYDEMGGCRQMPGSPQNACACACARQLLFWHAGPRVQELKGGRMMKDPLASVFNRPRSNGTFCIRMLASVFRMRVCGALLLDQVNQWRCCKELRGVPTPSDWFGPRIGRAW